MVYYTSVKCPKSGLLENRTLAWYTKTDLSGFMTYVLYSIYHGRNRLQVKLHVGIEPRSKAWGLQAVLAPVEGFAHHRLLCDLWHHVVHQLGVDKTRWVAAVVLKFRWEIEKGSFYFSILYVFWIFINCEMCTINVRYPNLSGTQAWTPCTVYGQSKFRTVVTSLDHLNKTKTIIL